MRVGARSPEQLITEHQGLVHSLAWRIHRKVPAHVELDDLVGYGQVGLAQAARDFDPTRGVQFTTFAYHRIRGAILDGLAEMDWFKRSHYYRGRYERLANEILTLQTDDSSQETAPSREENARWFRDAAGALAMVYLFCQQGGEEGSDMEVEDKSSLSPQSTLISRELKERLHELIEALPPESAELIKATYFEGLSLTEAGQRLGVSKSWASRLHSRTLDTLAHRLRLMQLAD